MALFENLNGNYKRKCGAERAQCAGGKVRIDLHITPYEFDLISDLAKEKGLTLTAFLKWAVNEATKEKT